MTEASPNKEPNPAPEQDIEDLAKELGLPRMDPEIERLIEAEHHEQVIHNMTTEEIRSIL